MNTIFFVFVLLLMVMSALTNGAEKTISQGNDTIVITQTILGEARGESYEAMKAVAAVIKVRAKERRLTYRQVCLQPFQFSCWNKNDPNRKKLKSLLQHPRAGWAWHIASNIDTLDTSMVRGANHYMTERLWKRGTVKWAKGKRPVAKHGCHVFFKL